MAKNAKTAIIIFIIIIIIIIIIIVIIIIIIQQKLSRSTSMQNLEVLGPKMTKLCPFQQSVDRPTDRQTDLHLHLQSSDGAKNLKCTLCHNEKSDVESDHRIILDVESPILHPYKSSYEVRFKQCVALANNVAYQRHPIYKGEKLTRHNEEYWLTNVNDDFLTFLVSYLLLIQKYIQSQCFQQKWSTLFHQKNDREFLKPCQ